MNYSYFVKYIYFFIMMISFMDGVEAKVAMPKMLSFNKMMDMIENGSPLYQTCPEYNEEMKKKYALTPHCIHQKIHNENIDRSLKEYLEFRGINSGNSLLHDAAKVKNKQAIEACLKAGYNMDARNSVDDTPWMLYGKEEWNQDFPDFKVSTDDDDENS